MKEIIIRMSEQEYEYMIHKSHIMGDEELYTRHGILTRAFERRTELPKGHGRLIDAGNVFSYAEDLYQAIDLAPTIIEADKED